MRNIGLDLLRLVAIVLVIGRHFHLRGSAPEVLKYWKQGGWVGVDLFFVLSGFLVSSLLFREFKKSAKVDIKKFLIRRGFKIYPSFWLFLAVSLLVRFFVLDDPPEWNEITGEVLFLQNYLGGIWNHTWSLAVEEHFYILIALFFYFVVRRLNRTTCAAAIAAVDPFRHLPICFGLVAAICLALRIGNLFWFPEYSHQVYKFPTHIRIDSLAFGVVLAYLVQFRNLSEKLSSIATWKFCLLGILLLTPPFLFKVEDHKWVTVFGFISYYLGSGLLVLAAIRLESTNSMLLKMLAALGAASYSIYLWHMPVGDWGYQAFKYLMGIGNFYIYLSVAFFGPLIVGWILNRLVEIPVLALRDFVFPANVTAASDLPVKQESK